MQRLPVKMALLVSLILSSSAALADAAWPRKELVLQRAEALATSIETLDEELHALNASDEVIEIVHHFEETVLAALEEFPALGYQEAKVEAQHIREDIFLVGDRLMASGFLRNPAALRAWNRVVWSYLTLEFAIARP